jgi:hypothetical protein
MNVVIGPLLVLLAASSARAQEACKTEMLKDPVLARSDMFRKAGAHAPNPGAVEKVLKD